MRLFFTFYILLFVFSSIQAQNNLQLLNKTFVYEAVLISENSDTITQEIIEINFSEKSWKFDTKQQELLIKYHTDTNRIKSFLHPFEKTRKRHVKNEEKKRRGKKGWEKWTWLEKEGKTGYVLNEDIFWMHPPRANQYLYTEITGMPEIHFDNLFTGGKWVSKLNILMGWDIFKGVLTSTYQVKNKMKFISHNLIIEDAWLIDVNHEHSKLGNYTSQVIFSPKEHGFLKFYHNYYDGKTLIMTLIDVK